ncbi:cytidylate kinase-like protein [Nocardia fluminea]|uniref:Cytidylate kinase-like protein n=1 Tax=Nocardia fluminea TaxID=134984 RepID=A0A2N3VHG9_9NOCA|nr:cytidylate kinase-like protein [Nocardia fluminea]
MSHMHVDDLAALLERTTPRLGSTKLVAVDGPGGAGKSTLATQLAAACTATLLHTDDFASWDNQFDWWPRLEQQILSPIARGRAGRYQRYDLGHKDFGGWHDVAPPAVLILEGVSAARAAVRDRLSLLVWVQTRPGYNSPEGSIAMETAHFRCGSVGWPTRIYTSPPTEHKNTLMSSSADKQFTHRRNPTDTHCYWSAHCEPPAVSVTSMPAAAKRSRTLSAAAQSSAARCWSCSVTKTSSA